uniref:ATP synthase F0 subunit 6 n=1 Tax=Malacocephalus laevis TaxID=630738 RepID=UPI0028FCB24F|nr:ATP synthase F0 subunit 6 [Malacocephalus laevis]WNH37761.1 ATP synthase F0 subunit 6 [Malacocephalus laevis]
MMTSLFNQFASPSFLNIPLVAIAMILPYLLYPALSERWAGNRVTTLFEWSLSRFANQIFLPLNLNAHKWAPLFLSLIVFLVASNVLGLLPYTFTPTTQLSLNLGLAVPLWLATLLIGLRNQPTAALGHLLPEGTPIPLIPLLIIIETISLLMRPLALGVRLTANLTAGHLLIHLVSSAIFFVATALPAAALLASCLLFLLVLLEMAVAVIQAFVFVLLLSLYLQENT